jgi:NAD(P)-dependent dehydrogenase (short-subunit alcohol dehydrogenase family)
MTDMKNVYVVTGATSGIGFATASTLLPHGRVIGVARSASRPLPDGVERLVCDISDVSDVRRLAAEIQQLGPITALVNNAAVGFGAEELIFRTNHLGPFLLTSLLADRCERVVFVASSVHKRAGALDWDALAAGRCGYSTSKLLNVMTAVELARRYPKLLANAADPGFVNSGLGRGASGAFRIMLLLTRPIQRTPEHGARTSVYLATAEVGTGGYYSNARAEPPAPVALDEAAGTRLWELSERLVANPTEAS